MAELKDYSSYEELLEAAKAAGIKEAKLDKAIEAYSLTNGEVNFVKVEVIDGDAAHIRVMTDKGELVSISNLISPAAFVESKKDIVGTQQTTAPEKESYNMWFVKGTRLNGGFANDQAKLAMWLKGKKFVSEQVQGFVVPYTEDKTTKKPIFCKTEKELQSKGVLKTFHKLTLVEN